MSGRIYLLHGQDQLVAMTEQPYESEDLLQELPASYPNLLAGEQISRDAPRRWLLIRREQSMPSEEGGTGRWSADHLFFDQDAIPTVVETKRSSDTRIRRDIVGQMLDYAANAVLYWPVDRLRGEFEATCTEQGLDPMTVLFDALGIVDAEEFWQQAKTNLQAGKIRLLFAADKIPAELRRIVEFLNAQMDPAEVLAVEISQYMGQGQRVLVPRVIGQTVQAQTKVAGIKQWDESSFFRALEAQHGASNAAVARKIVGWAQSKRLRVWGGKGKQIGSLNIGLDHHGVLHRLLAVWTSGTVTVQFGYLLANSPFDTEDKRLDVVRRLNEIQGIDLDPASITGYPGVLFATLQDAAVLGQFLAVFDWAIQEISGT